MMAADQSQPETINVLQSAPSFHNAYFAKKICEPHLQF
jgi:hypothetical protein